MPTLLRVSCPNRSRKRTPGKARKKSRPSSSTSRRNIDCPPSGAGTPPATFFMSLSGWRNSPCNSRRSLACERSTQLKLNPCAALLLRRPWLCLVGRGHGSRPHAIDWLMNNRVRHTSSTAYDPRCAYCGRPVLGVQIYGNDGVYHPACVQPPPFRNTQHQPYNPPPTRYEVTHPVTHGTGDPLTPANFTTSP